MVLRQVRTAVLLLLLLFDAALRSPLSVTSTVIPSLALPTLLPPARVLVAAAFLLSSMLATVFAWRKGAFAVVWRPSERLAWVAMTCLDALALCAVMQVLGAAAAPVYLLLVLVAIDAAMRPLGRLAIPTLAFILAAFVGCIATSTFWNTHPSLSACALAALAIVPMAAIVRLTARVNEAGFLLHHTLAAVATRVGDAVVTTDAGARIASMNAAAEVLSGWSIETALGKPVEEVLSWKPDKASDPLAVSAHPVVRCLRSAAKLDAITGMIEHRSGAVDKVEASAEPVMDAAAQVVGALLVCRRAESVQALAARLSHQSLHDAVTGLPNSRTLRMHAIAAATRTSVSADQAALVYIGVRGLRATVDSLGVAAADELMCRMAAIVVSCLPSAASAYRVGDAILAMLFQGHDAVAAAQGTARAVLDAARAGFHAGTLPLHPTLHMGMSVYPHDSTDAMVWIRSAGAAMARARALGEGDLQRYGEHIAVAGRRRIEIERSLRRLLHAGGRGADGSLEVFYQPRVDCRTGHVASVEALARWRLPDGTLLSPAVFVPVAEESRLIVEMDQYVMRMAAAASRRWRNAGAGKIRMACNLSSVDLAAAGLIDSVAAVLHANALEPSSLEMELTESAMMRDVARSAAVLTDLRRMGVAVAVDDFGTGYSSLSYLCRLPVDIVKIDRSFIDGIHVDPRRAEVAAAIASLAKTLGCRVVAEGVEVPAHAHLLMPHCDELQGYLFGHPVPANAMESLLRADAARAREERARLEVLSASGAHTVMPPDLAPLIAWGSSWAQPEADAWPSQGVTSTSG